MMQKKYIIRFSIILISCLISIWLYFLFSTVVTEKNGYVYYLRPGISKRLVIQDLQQRGIITHPTALLIYTLPQKNAALKTGEYHFIKGSTTHSIWKQITTGSGLLYHPFAIIPGWTFKQLRTALMKAEGLRHTTAVMDDKQIMERLGYPNLSPEGEFFPDTYNYTRNDSDFMILKRAFNLMQKKIQELWKNRAAKLPYNNPYDALIMASLIEREAYLDCERPVIAGVLTNRLYNDMLLQVDATVIYGLGDRYTGKIYKQNLLEDTPYNSYLHKGLPPTPIAMPGLASLTAAMHPEQNNFYYYVAKGNGAHEFSMTLDAHKTAVELNQKSKSNTNQAQPLMTQ
jgi:UPF0755 protein